ncbi:MAG: hypothetical protein RBS80_07720 [Thermoguttaceae bacterium]|jgi:hypothetical protein|nr:hypothetical protein [Thermoguttaceae bacterium]
MSRHTGIVAGALGAAAVTGVGVIFGWAMDQSLMPPFGGGWRCYAACVAIAWGLAVIVPLPVLVSRFGKAVARHWAQRWKVANHTMQWTRGRRRG